MKSNIITMFGVLNSKISSLLKSTKDVTTDVGTLQTNVGNLQTDVGNLQTTVGGLQTDVTNLQKQKSILCAGIDSAFTVSTGGDNTIEIDKEIEKIGNNIEIDTTNKAIKIVGDISKILISVKIQMELKQNSGNIKNIYIHKNNTPVIDILNDYVRSTDNVRYSVSASEIPVSVQKNDLIYLKGYFGVGDKIQNQSPRTYITVKEV